MHHTENHECINLCWEARTHCIDTLTHYCLLKGGKHVNSEHVKKMLDCIDICQVAADSMKRGSPLYQFICAAAAAVCGACATSCDDLGDEKMKQCADACRRAADACQIEGRKLSKAA